MSENPKTTEHTHPITICLDFDGVCNTYTGWEGDDELYEPQAGLRAFLERLKTMGYEIVVFSTRPAAVLSYWFHQHRLRHLIDGFPTSKPPAVMYVDDRGFNFSGDFDEVIDEIEAYGTEPWWHKLCWKDRPRESVTLNLSPDLPEHLTGHAVLDLAGCDQTTALARMRLALKDLEREFTKAIKERCPAE